MRIHDVLRKAATASPSDAVSVAARVMRDQNASSAIVVENGTIVGVLTERDLVTKCVAENRNPSDLLVADLMSRVDTPNDEQMRGRIIDLLGSPASSLEDAEGVYELALTGAPIDLTLIPGVE